MEENELTEEEILEILGGAEIKPANPVICEYSPRGYCMREINGGECSQNYHDCRNHFEGGDLKND